MNRKLFFLVFMNLALFSEERDLSEISIEKREPSMAFAKAKASRSTFFEESSLPTVFSEDASTVALAIEKTSCTEPVEEKRSLASSRFYIGGSAGYGFVSGTYGADGQTPQGRFVLGRDMCVCKRFVFGFELGVQSGNTMRIKAKQTLIDTAGGLPIQTTLKPLLDFLVVNRWKLKKDFWLLVKGGIAYRNLQFIDRSSSEDSLHRINGEVQIGFAFPVTERARIVTFYQIIFSGKNAATSLAPNDDVLMHRIPTQQGAFLGVEWAL